MTASSRIQPGRFFLTSLRLLCLPHASQALRTPAQGERQARVVHAPVDIARRKDHIRRTTGVAETPHGLHERTQDDVAVVGTPPRK